ncbi:Serine/threonine-protein kinase PAK 5 [Sporothrix eucalyptigena]|uniref:non-specific serine/threonine protein kinase n=1 Tax=Sporothrix eucalyptigena TaxID=1812306 RepID=A0ABP0B4M0_9PEZI
MNRRQSLAVPSQIKAKAIDEARRTQAAVLRDCAAAHCDPPPYVLTELIGKGSFGRVFKATTTNNTKDGPAVVAVKIISIEEGDAAATDAGADSHVNAPPPTPRNDNDGPQTHSAASAVVDTFGDVLKEIRTLQLLGASGARNINTVLDSLLVGPTVWMVTEYCAGGSVATLMRPTGYLPEKWIVPILREVAEALFWVHGQGIIHRDIKCANVLVADMPDGANDGALGSVVQLCDFGVAGFVETAVDKRRTVTGTLHWMAPELFRADVEYGTEVDIWAFGSMAYEVASGLPPNAAMTASLVGTSGGGFDISSFGTYLEQNCPRLVGNQYSDTLKELVASCMVHDPAQRPSIEQVQRFRYIANTAESHPTSSLSTLLAAHRLWQARGGDRQSLFSAGGARSAADIEDGRAARLPDWDFDDDGDDDDDDDSGDSFSLDFEASTLAVYEAYGISLDKSPSLPPTPRPLPPLPLASPPLPPQSRLRRRLPPVNTATRNMPLQGVFDPNTLTNYHDKARAVYGRQSPHVPSSTKPSDLPLRDYSSKTPDDRDSLIDLDLSVVVDENALESQNTIRPNNRSDMVSVDAIRPRTQDWTFPVAMAASPIANKDIAAGGPRPPVLDNIDSAQKNRLSTASLIDLDAATGPGADIVAGNDDVDIDDTPFEFDTMGNLDAIDARAKYGPFSLPPVPLAPARRVLQGTATRNEIRDELLRMLSSLGEHLQIMV